jgi:uncharacterized Zn finger protein
MAKKYGVTIWGAELLKVLEQKSDSGRLARGRSYANTGKVYDISLSGTHIRAKVRGNYSPYYSTKYQIKKNPKRGIEIAEKEIWQLNI